jgi:hypothetical protein
MNPIVLAVIILVLELFTGMFAAMSLVSFFPDAEGRREGGSPTRGRPG